MSLTNNRAKKAILCLWVLDSGYDANIKIVLLLLGFNSLLVYQGEISSSFPLKCQGDTVFFLAVLPMKDSTTSMC